MAMKRYISLLAAVACCVAAVAQLEDVTVTPLNNADQLPVNEITQIFQDSEGFVWYGTTDGLCRDDGYNIHVFRKDVFHPELVDVNSVTDIAEDHSNHLWISTASGLLRMDRATFEMVRVGDDELQQSHVDYLLAASDGTIWAMGDRHLYHITPEATIIDTYDMPEDITCLYEDSRHRIFVSRFEHGLMMLQPGDTQFRIVAPDYQISAMIEDTVNHCYWLCDRNTGIIRYTETGHDSSPQFIHQDPVKDDYGMTITFFTHLVQDNRFHYIWAISYYRGLYVFRPGPDGRLQRMSTTGFLPQNHHIYYNIMKSGSGHLWVTGFDTSSFVINLDKKHIAYNPLASLAQSTHFSPSVAALYRDEGRIYWVMQKRNNLRLYDAQTDTWADYMRQPDVSRYPLYLTQQLQPSHRPGHVWAVTPDDVFLLTRHDMKFDVVRAIRVNIDVNDRTAITTALEDSRQNLWIGTKNGLYLCRKDAGKIEKTGDSIGEISDIVEDDRGNVWCTVRNHGLLKISADGTNTHYPLNIDLLTLVYIKPHLWAGTREGRVYRFDETETDGRRFTDFTEDCGMNGDCIEQLETDCYDHLWVITNQRVKEYNPENGAFRTTNCFEPGSPFLRFIPRSTFVDPADSMIYIGGIPGFMSLSPSRELESRPASVMPLITDIIVGTTSVWFEPRQHTDDKVITIDHTAHNLTITFSALDFSNRQNIRYAYRLDGIDDDWTELDAGHNAAIYGRLPKGRYTFHVKSTDANGLWCDTETTIVIRRLPAWYETTMAYTIYTLLAILVVAAIIYIYKRRLERQSQQQLNENITQAKMMYFTSISHELLTPLTIINLLAERLHTTDGSADTPRLIQANVARLRRLLQQVLDFRKVESRNMKLYVEQTNITDFLRTLCRESFEPLAADKHIEFLTLLPARDICGYTDRDKMEKILFNLVSNALKYTPDGRTVTLSATEQNQQLTLSVKDEGIGIDPREQSFIFNRFYSSKKNNNTISNGIGLSLTKDLVELHHGTIRVISQPKKGSEFIVEMPIGRHSFSEAELKDENASQAMHDTHDPSTTSRTQQQAAEATQVRLLMVEDNLELLAAMQDMLSEHYTVFAARDGIEALDILSEEDISIVVSDISMPRMDGIELCRRIKSDVSMSHTILVLLTAMTSTQTQVEAYGAGADAYLPKPFDTNVLLSLLANLLDSRAKMQQRLQHTVMQAAAEDLEVSDLDREFVQKAIKMVERHISDSDYDVEALCSDMIMSRSTLTRKLKALAGQTPIQFIRNIRLKYAYRLLQNHTVSVADAMYRVGYNDHRSFTLAFKDTFGIMPSEVK